MRDRGVKPLAVKDQVPIVGELNPVTTAGHHALNVELVLRQALNAFGFEHDNLAALRREKVIRDPVNEEMISGANLKFHDVLALAEGLVAAQRVDFGAGLADHDARTSRVDVDLELLRILTDRDVRQAGMSELADDVRADLDRS